MRGFAALGLYQPKLEFNVGGALRAAQIFQAGLVVVQGRRYERQPTDTMAAYRHLPVQHVEDLLTAVPFDCVPVAIERIEGARCLSTYTHPRSAFYIFGPEDGSVPRSVLDRCRDVVCIPAGSLNLAAAVNVVLYDRVA
jgi:tRNA(Leu) C34 or U34 (ribose-2'-O)-methylase TrmL